MESAWSDLPEAFERLVGCMLAGRYVVDDVIGLGGMAGVFRAHHSTLQKPVAIKVIRPELSGSQELLARFEREARATSSFEHPNCTQVFDCGFTHSGLRFMVMPLLDGCELARVVGEPIPPSQCVGIATQLLRGLEYAHGRGVVHRDLKPENIFVTRDHTGKELLKIVDFGVAKLVDHDPPDGLKTRVGTVVGTPAYMSPEQVSGMDVDARTDLYALGVIMYELLAGSLPFEGSTPYAPRLRQPGEAVPPLPSSVPAVLSAVITQLLAFDRARRFASATETIFALRPANDALKRDPTPWVQLLPSQSAPTRPRKPSPMHAVDAALRRVIEQPEPAIDDLLIQGIRETSAPATGWDLDASTLELEELGPKTSND